MSFLDSIPEVYLFASLLSGLLFILSSIVFNRLRLTAVTIKESNRIPTLEDYMMDKAGRMAGHVIRSFRNSFVIIIVVAFIVSTADQFESNSSLDQITRANTWSYFKQGAFSQVFWMTMLFYFSLGSIVGGVTYGEIQGFDRWSSSPKRELIVSRVIIILVSIVCGLLLAAISVVLIQNMPFERKGFWILFGIWIFVQWHLYVFGCPHKKDYSVFNRAGLFDRYFACIGGFILGLLQGIIGLREGDEDEDDY